MTTLRTGGKISVGNYEMLEWSVEGASIEEINAARDALFETLGGDEVTRQAIDAYRRRVFRTIAPVVKDEVPAGFVRASEKKAAEPPKQEAPAPAPAAAPAPKPAPAKPAAEGTVCVGCGATVTVSQGKLSQLFNGKTLCKKCMEAP